MLLHSVIMYIEVNLIHQIMRTTSSRLMDSSSQTPCSCLSPARRPDGHKIRMPTSSALLCLLLFALWTPQTLGFEEDDSEPSVPWPMQQGAPLIEQLNPFHKLSPDAFYDPPNFIRSRKFIAEVHRVLTKDNYIITLHRVVNPLVPGHLRHKLKPALLQHGLFTSSYNFLVGSDRNNDRPRFDPRDLTRVTPRYTPTLPTLLGYAQMFARLNAHNVNPGEIYTTGDIMLSPRPSDSLALEMANQGYDVWLANSRGSTYSLNHTHYDYRTDWRYWDFSFHEIGLYDIPATIDYILNLRRRKSLAFLGHSQGNLAMFILQSLHPEWSQKVKPFVAISPVVHLTNVYYGAMRVLINLIESTLITTTQLNRIIKGQLFPNTPEKSQALDLVCVPKWSTKICNLALTLLQGNNLLRHNDTKTPVIAHHIPEGTSTLNILHFGQLIQSGEFKAFDFGPEENLRRYGTTTSPFYPVRNINSPDIAFISGKTDALSTPKNVRVTRQMLRVPLIDDYVAPDIFWGHGDHMYAIGAGQLVNAHVVGLCDRYRLID